jgi:DNA-binding beta-propeller fold protein YncE
LEGPTAVSASVVLTANSAWTATANAPWLHLSAANQNGTGSATVIFTVDANPGATRTGTLTIAARTLNVSQAGSTYVAITNATSLVSSGLSLPSGVAVDGAGNVYFADSGNNAIKEWITASNAVITLVSSGLSSPNSVAVDGLGDVYIADSNNNAIKEWLAASNTVITLVSSGLELPFGVAVDGSGNVYIADTQHRAIKEWLAVGNTVDTLMSSGSFRPFGLAVDGLGSVVYIADSNNNAIKEWSAASNAVFTLVSSGLSGPTGVAVDGSGNVYIAENGDGAVKEWLAASNTVITLVSSGLNSPYGVAADGLGNVFIADTYNNAIKELPRAFVDPTAKTEPASGGGDTLPVVLSASVNLTGPFTPTSNSSWLNINGVTNGVVSFAFTANSSPTNRTANITVLGMAIPVTQSATPITPPSLTGVAMLNNGVFQFGFSNTPGASFTVWTATNLSTPLTNWMMLGPPVYSVPGKYQFTDPAATNDVQRFYRVSSP